MGLGKVSRIFIKYLLSYLMILLIPMGVITFVVYNVFVNKLQEETISGNVNTLDKIRYAVDDQMKRVNDTTYQLMLEDNRLSQFKVSDDQGYKAWGITSELKRYQKMNPFVQEIWLYYPGDPSVYTSSGAYSLTHLTEYVYRFAEWSSGQLKHDLSQLSATTIIPSMLDKKEQERYVVVMVPVLPFEHKPYATVVHMIKQKSLERLLSSHMPTGSSTWVLDQDNRVIAGQGEAIELRTEEVEALAAGETDSVARRVTLGTDEYYWFMVPSKQTGWKYVTLLPVKLIMGKVEQSKTLFIYGLATVLVAGAAFIYFSMRWNYRPIRQLKLVADQILPAKERPLNELEAVRHAISSLAQQNKQLDERVRSRSAAAKKHLLLAVVKGDITSAEELQRCEEEAGLALSGSRFRAALVQLSEAKEQGGEMPLETLESLLPAGLKGYGTEHVDKNKFIFLMATDGLDAQAFMERMSAFRTAIRLAAGRAVTIGVGREEELLDIPHSYLEANTASDYRFIQGIDRVIDFADIPPSSHSAEDRYPHAEMEALRQSIRKGSAAKVESALSAMLSFIRAAQPPLLVARGLCLDIIWTVNRAWSELGLRDESPSGYLDVFTLERLDTIDDFEQLIKSVCIDLCHAFGGGKESEPAVRSIEQMLEYIRSHCCRCDFSFQHMADHFHMALPNLSQFFKDQTGQTLIDYTTKLRMDMAKRLLVENDLPLKSIAEEVGYYNVSSFIRRFKQLVGMTPGEYRVQFKA